LGNAIAARDVNAQLGNLAVESRELQEQHAQLRRQLDAQKARADALAAALRSVLQRLGPTAGPAEVEAVRALVTHT
jgi:hypothetical protein